MSEQMHSAVLEREKESFAIELLGSGRLRDALAQRLQGRWRLIDGIDRAGSIDRAGTASLVVAAADTAAGLDELWTAAAARGVPWLPLHAELDRIVIGPFTRAGLPGCPWCVRLRRSRARRDPEADAALLARFGSAVAATLSPLLGRSAADCAAAIVLDDIEASSSDRRPRTLGAIVELQLSGLSSSVHRYLPHAACASCGALPDDSAEAAMLVPRALPARKGSFRTRDLAALEPQLLASYVDDATGLLGQLQNSGDFSLPVVAARIHSSAVGDVGYGRTTSFRSSRLTAIAEALERFGGGRPRGKRTTVCGSYRELSDKALDPELLGQHDPQHYARVDFPYRRYHPELQLRWVWGYSFARAEPILVPESYAYYRTASSDAPAEERPFVYEISNGCALGSTVEEAAIAGLLELAERDAFLMTWYAQLRLNRLDPGSMQDARIALTLERLAHRTGHSVAIFENTLEQGIPTFWVMAVDPSPQPERPRALCAGGSALDPEVGILNALQELVTGVESYLTRFPPQRERAAQMVSDPRLVRAMEDHALLYGHEAAFHRLSFLLDAEPQPLARFHAKWSRSHSSDVRAQLMELVQRFGQGGLDVVVVDQTTAEHRACGFACVKTIVPGLLPMTFGHDNRRVQGLPRLREVPWRLGYRSAPLSAAEFNPHPHPFP